MGRLQRRPRRAALVGNPNVGKSSLFNALTGLHQKVSNYPGTTVERIVGTCAAQGGTVEIVDLPGTYSLLPHSPDEEVVRDQLLGRSAGEAAPDVVVVVLDATNVERSLFLASQVFELGRPVVVALNQVDLAVERGIRVDADLLAERLGVTVVPTCGRTQQGRDALAEAILAGGRRPRPMDLVLPGDVRREAAALAPSFDGVPGLVATPEATARLLLSEADACDAHAALTVFGRTDVAEQVRAARARLAAAGCDVETGTAAARYAAIARLIDGVVGPAASASGWRGRLDRFLLHPVGGGVALVVAFALVFLAIFKGTVPLQDLVGDTIAAAGGWAAEAAGGGLVGNFVEAGVFAGFGSFLVFVPQIAVFFLLLELLDDTGYLARAAFLLDRAMGRFGLPGRAFLPLLSGFACAIPGIMSTRTMGNFRDRMVTMAVLPLMSCSARLPVYALVVAVVFSNADWWVGTAVVVSMYFVGILVALAASSVLRRTILRGGRTPLLLELPPYRAPVLRSVARNVARRTWAFVAGAGPTIFVLSLVLWGLLTFPRAEVLSRDYDADAAPHEAALAAAVERGAAEEVGPLEEAVAAVRNAEQAERRERSYLGRMGKAIEPAIEPLGFDWKIGVGIIGSFAAREVFVGTLGVIYAAGEDADEEDVGLREKLRRETWPSGRPVYTPLSGISLCVFYVLAMQCMSTLAVLKRESGGWKWPAGIFVALTILAYTASLAVYQGGLALGL